jgi:starvation-inducible outer membrane lipoprotein
MKAKITALALGSSAALLLQGCIAFPPLIQVEHKDSANNQEIVKRLDAIDNRLNQLEKTNAQKSEQKSDQK